MHKHETRNMPQTKKKTKKNNSPKKWWQLICDFVNFRDFIYQRVQSKSVFHNATSLWGKKRMADTEAGDCQSVSAENCGNSRQSNKSNSFLHEDSNWCFCLRANLLPLQWQFFFFCAAVVVGAVASFLNTIFDAFKMRAFWLFFAFAFASVFVLYFLVYFFFFCFLVLNTTTMQFGAFVAYRNCMPHSHACETSCIPLTISWPGWCGSRAEVHWTAEWVAGNRSITATAHEQQQ